MPRGDGTGPMGHGPMTGRGSGVCILRIDDTDSETMSGFAGIEGRRVEIANNNTSAYAKATADKKEVSQMPGGDGTGPMGAGPMTGRAAGLCAGNAVPGYMTPGPGRGFGMGFGRGRGGRGFGMGFRGSRGWCANWGAPHAMAPTAEQELDVLKGQAEYFSGALEDIKKRMGELETGKKTE